MPNPFEKHGIDHLSASSINCYVEQPSWWCAKYLLGARDEVGPAAWRGSAVEAGLDWWLFQHDDMDAREQALTKAHARFEVDAKGLIRDDIDKERDSIEPMLMIAIAHMGNVSTPDARQLKAEYWIEGIEVPLLLYIDYVWSDFVLDLKTTHRLPSEIPGAHGRQAALYAAAKNRVGRLLYVSTKKSEVFELSKGQVEYHLQWLGIYAHRIRTLLSVMPDGGTAASIFAPNLDNFYWKSNAAKAAAEQIWKGQDTMKISDAFPSKYLKASDIKGHRVPVKLSHVTKEEVGENNDLKPILYFVGKDKGLVLNKTNAEILHVCYGDETDDWRDKPAVLSTAPTRFAGKIVDGITVEVPGTAEVSETPF